MSRKSARRYGRYATIPEVKSTMYAKNDNMERMADPRGSAFDEGKI